jgi:tryptophan 2,3-dioxygenase
MNYGRYLQLDKVLAAQAPQTAAHDELQFIIVHQHFELWFKLALYELEALRAHLFAGELVESQHLMRRLHAIMRLLNDSFDVIETMRPYDFLQFRTQLQPASGLQSRQFREIEFLCGLKDPRYLGVAQGEDREVLQRRLSEPGLWDAYVDVVGRCGLDAAKPALLGSIIHIMKAPDAHPLGPMTENLVEFDELFSLWRARHVRMTMRMIGHKRGTGEASVQALGADAHMGAGGVDYLQRTVDKLFFPLLWEARTFIERL